MDKKRLLKTIHQYVLVTIGTFILAFGSVVFLSKSELVAGGVSGIAIIIQHFVSVNIYDYVVAALMVITWLMGLIFVDKKFAIKTLYSSIVFVGFTFLLNRVPVFDEMAKTFAGTLDGEESTVGHLILCALFGGVFVGTGVAVTFLGHGSTGGVDVLQVILRKYFQIKESYSSMMIDGFIIVVGMLTMRLWILAGCGLLASVMTAVLVDVVYIQHQTSYQADIISDHWQEISQYAQDVLERGVTIIHAEGGYKGEERIIVRIVFDRMQYDKLRDYLATVDPKAFVTFTQTNAVYGEGFNSNKKIIKPIKK